MQLGAELALQRERINMKREDPGAICIFMYICICVNIYTYMK